MNVPANILALVMIDGRMLREIKLGLAILARVVAHQLRARVNVRCKLCFQRFGRNVRHMPRTRAA